MRINQELTPKVYSTNEQKIGKWVDGSDLYRKTIYVSSLPNSSYTNIAHNISNLNVITDIQGIMRTPGNKTTVAFNFIGVDALYGTNARLLVRADATNVVIGTTSDWRNNEAYITLEYTKS